MIKIETTRGVEHVFFGVKQMCFINHKAKKPKAPNQVIFDDWKLETHLTLEEINAQINAHTNAVYQQRALVQKRAMGSGGDTRRSGQGITAEATLSNPVDLTNRANGA